MNKNKKIYLIVQYAGMDKTAQVELKQPKELTDITEGMELILKCQAEGNPEPSVEWYRNKIR